MNTRFTGPRGKHTILPKIIEKGAEEGKEEKGGRRENSPVPPYGDHISTRS